MEARRSTIGEPSPAIRLLTGGEIELGAGTVANWKSRASRLLFVLLALDTGRPVSRDRLAGLLWPDQDQQSAKHNLRTALSVLRKTIREMGLPDLSASRSAICLEIAPEDIDVHRFLRLVSAKSRSAVEAALDLYRGDLEADPMMASDIVPEPVAVARENLKRTCIDACAWLLEHAEADGDGALMRTTARRLLALEPANEVAHLAMVRAYLLDGDRTGAFRQFDLYVHDLKEHLDLEPSPAARELYERMLSQGADAHAPPAAGADGYLDRLAIRPSLRKAVRSRFARLVQSRRRLVGLALAGLCTLVLAGYMILSTGKRGAGSDERLIMLSPIADVGLTCPDAAFAREFTYAQELAFLDLPGVSILLSSDGMPGLREPVRAYAVEIGMQCIDDTVRLTVQARHHADDHVLWAARYEGKTSESGLLAERIAAAFDRLTRAP